MCDEIEKEMQMSEDKSTPPFYPAQHATAGDIAKLYKVMLTMQNSLVQIAKTLRSVHIIVAIVGLIVFLASLLVALNILLPTR
jgi:hypothetical protein